mmetsp:Transcript_68316/g.192644  ORF Transcript_68316/g.192644 Transcript_68316/m.192644 type:complete len:238 (-) Transcript_68316:629-1342(-)
MGSADVHAGPHGPERVGVARIEGQLVERPEHARQRRHLHALARPQLLELGVGEVAGALGGAEAARRVVDEDVYVGRVVQAETEHLALVVARHLDAARGTNVDDLLRQHLVLAAPVGVDVEGGDRIPARRPLDRLHDARVGRRVVDLDGVLVLEPDASSVHEPLPPLVRPDVLVPVVPRVCVDAAPVEVGVVVLDEGAVLALEPLTVPHVLLVHHVDAAVRVNPLLQENAVGHALIAI